MKHTTQDLLFLIPVSLFFFVYQLGTGSLASWDEAVYATVAKGILLTGDWLRLELDGHLWFDKPPLTIWATALSYKLFGVHEFSARIFSALCGVGTVVTTYFLGRQLFNRWTGLIGALVLLSSSHYIHFVRFGMMDSPLTFFLTLAFYFFWLGQNRNRYLVFSGVAIGLAMMTKSFAALMIFPVIWLYALWAGRLNVLARSSYWIGVMIAVLIALPWNLYELFVYRDLFLSQAVTKHVVLRVFNSLEGHEGNWYFYIRVLVNKYHPWILIAIVTAPYFLWKSIRERREEVVFLTSWMFVIFGIITFIQTKLAWYILPLYPALSLSVAYALAHVFKEKNIRWIQALSVAAMMFHIPYSHIFDYDYSPLIKGIASEVRAKTAKDEVIALYNYHESPAASFYIGHGSIYLDSQTALEERLKAGKLKLLIREEDVKNLGGEAYFQKRGLGSAGSFETMRFFVTRD